MVSNYLIARIEQNQISLRNKLLDKLRGYRTEQEGICADFVATNGPKLQEEEAGCEALALAIADARDGAARSVMRAHKMHVNVSHACFLNDCLWWL